MKTRLSVIAVSHIRSQGWRGIKILISQYAVVLVRIQHVGQVARDCSALLGDRLARVVKIRKSPGHFSILLSMSSFHRAKRLANLFDPTGIEAETSSRRP